MIKEDEIKFMRFILDQGGRIPRSAWNNLGKREYYMLEKWTNNGFWNYGVSSRSGWVTPQGIAHFEALVKQSPR